MINRIFNKGPLLRLLSLCMMGLCFLGVTYAQEETIPRFEAGGHFSTLGIEDSHIIPELGLGARRELGFGGRFGVNLNRYFALEAELNFFPRDYRLLITPNTGGRVTQGLFGLKAGIRKNKIGFFGKIRPGFQSSAHAAVARFPDGDGPESGDPFGFEVVRSFQPTLDIGGVFEVYPSRRFLVRFDAGDTITRYPPLEFICFPAGVVCPETPYTHKFQMSAGVSVRF